MRRYRAEIVREKKMKRDLEVNLAEWTVGKNDFYLISFYNLRKF